jgi:tyrosinase
VGWNPYGLHNQVHAWIGRGMGLASSPNDPVFYLHHCNVDRIWFALRGARGL